MKIFVKNMVCNRCILIVQQELEKMNIEITQIELGEVDLLTKISHKKMKELNDHLENLGFELLIDSNKKQIEKIKSLLIQKIQQGNIEEHFSISKFLTGFFQKDYNYITRLFSEVESITIEQFFILQKIEKVNEWITYDELNLTEIAWKLGYSSTAHLSAQFKKVSGLTARHFKKLAGKRRKSLDAI
jgi:AraC family transcriptional regulator